MNSVTPQSSPARRRGRTAVAILGAAVLVGGAIIAGVLFRGADRPAAPTDPAAGTALEKRLQPLVDAGYPGILASVTSPDGKVQNAVAGKGNIKTGEAPPLDAEVRIASNTKMFVATVVLQLVDEGLVDLNAVLLEQYRIVVDALDATLCDQ